MRFTPVRLGADHERLRAEVRTFLAREGGGEGFDGLGVVSGSDPEFSRRLADAGYVGMALPGEYGGKDRTPLDRFVVVEELLAAGAPVSFHWTADRQTGPMIARFGTESQRERFLPPISRGEMGFAIGMSEPDAGSDLAAVASQARPVEGGWVLNGTKIWTSGAADVGWALVLCRTAPRDGDRHAGLSQLIVPLDSPGVEIRPITFIDGSRRFAEVVFTDVFVPDDMVLGTVGMGWAQVTSELGFERAGPDRYMSSSALLDGFVSQVRRSGADVRHLCAIGDLASRWWVIRQLSLSVAQMITDHESPHAEAALVKDLGTTFEQEIIERLTRELSVEIDAGPTASRFDRLLAKATLIGPSYTIRGGTTEVLRTICARHLGAGPLFPDPVRSDDLVVSTVAQMLEPFSTPADIAAAETRAHPVGELWRSLLDSQMLGIGVDEALGGSGGTEQQLFSIVPLTGRSCAYVPFVETALASWLLAAAELPVPPSATLTIALADATHPMQAVRDGAGVRVSGSYDRVAWARSADQVVTLVDIDHVPHVVAIALAGAGIEAGSNLAGEPRDRVTFDDHPLEPAYIAAAPSWLTVDTVFRRAAFMRSLQIAGACERAVDLGLQYATERVQFGKPIGAFQAVQHHLVRSAGEVALVRVACEVAAALATTELEEHAMTVANVVARRAARTVAAAMHQAHGAIGLTREYALQLHTRRLWSWQQEFGAEAAWSERLGRSIIDQDGDLWPIIATGLVAS